VKEGQLPPDAKVPKHPVIHTPKQYIPGQKESYTEDEVLEFLLHRDQEMAEKRVAKAKPVAEPSVVKPFKPIAEQPSKLAETKPITKMKPVAKPSPAAAVFPSGY
jgi:hypothetical protein